MTSSSETLKFEITSASIDSISSFVSEVVTVLETSKLYELTKFHFMNLLINNDCFFDLKEKLDSSSYEEHSLVIDLLDSLDVSLEKF